MTVYGATKTAASVAWMAAVTPFSKLFNVVVMNKFYEFSFGENFVAEINYRYYKLHSPGYIPGKSGS